MRENLYDITSSILQEIANYAAKHPETHFCADELSDEEGNFLRCFFLDDEHYTKDDEPVWELSGDEK